MGEPRGAKIMAIDDIVKALTRISRLVDKGIPHTPRSPDALVERLNDLYAESVKGISSQELFTYDDVVSPTITLTISVEAEFDIKKVMENIRTKLNEAQRGKADALGTTGIIGSYGHYDFMYDDESELLRITHKYGHKPEDTRSVLSIMKKMIDYAKGYLEEVKKSAQE